MNLCLYFTNSKSRRINSFSLLQGDFDFNGTFTINGILVKVWGLEVELGEAVHVTTTVGTAQALLDVGTLLLNYKFLQTDYKINNIATVKTESEMIMPSFIAYIETKCLKQNLNYSRVIDTKLRIYKLLKSM